MKKQFTIVLSLLCCCGLSATDCLYPELEGKTGNEIKAVLHDKIVNHTVLAYSSVWAKNSGADDKGDGTENIWDMYSNCTFSKWNSCNSSNYDTDVECECYNREHVLPKSWWGSSEDEPMYTDLHHVIPTDNATNSQRGAYPLGEVPDSKAEWSNAAGCKLGYGTFGTSGYDKTFEVPDEYKGDIARIYFYMATCYSDKNFTQGGKGYKVFISNSATFTTTALNLYLKWHRNDPVSDKERTRNNKVEKKQKNRNPFVDAPELVEYIWGNKKTTAYSCTSQDIEDVAVEETHAASKILLNGQLYILRDGKVYSITGAQVR